MSVNLRGRRYHYRFMVKGEIAHGPCPGCEVTPGMSPMEIAAVRRKAEQYEAEIRPKIAKEIKEMKEVDADIRKNRTVRALIENYRYELTGGKPVSLDEAFVLASEKPTQRESGEEHKEQRKLYWNDFRAYMRDTFPAIKDLASVRRTHCESYVKYLMDHGRYVKKIQYVRKGSWKPGHKHPTPDRVITYHYAYKLSPKTIREIAGTCRNVFTRLFEDAGLISDPWIGVVLPIGRAVDREVFSPDELRLIWDGIQTDDFCRPLFMIAANSGLTEGDICMLRWKEFDWNAGVFRSHRRKTGVRITLPLLPELSNYIQSLPQTGEYVLPEHAAMYQHDPTLVSERVKRFLDKLGIVSKVSVPGRRAVSIKDLHSMRHVFCYRAKRAGIPESVIMKFVGHSVLEMTQHYADHDTIEDLRQEIQKIPALFFGAPGMETQQDSMLRQHLAQAAYSLPLPQIKALLSGLASTALPAQCICPAIPALPRP